MLRSNQIGAGVSDLLGENQNTEHTSLIRSNDFIPVYNTLDYSSTSISTSITDSSILQRIKDNHQLSSFLTRIIAAQEYIKSAIRNRNKKRILLGLSILTGLTAVGGLLYIGSYLINIQNGYLHHNSIFKFEANGTTCTLSPLETNLFLDNWDTHHIRVDLHWFYERVTSCDLLKRGFPISSTDNLFARSLLALPNECKNELITICQQLKAGTINEDDDAYIPYLIGAVISYAGAGGILAMPLFFLLWFILRNSSMPNKLYQSLNHLLFDQNDADKLNNINLKVNAETAYNVNDIEKGISNIRFQFFSNVFVEQLQANRNTNDNKDHDAIKYLCRFFSPKNLTKISMINRTTYELANEVKNKGIDFDV